MNLPRELEDLFPVPGGGKERRVHAAGGLRCSLCRLAFLVVGAKLRRGLGWDEVIFGQIRRAYLEWGKLIMPLLFSRQPVVCSVEHYKKSRIPTDRQICLACNRVTYEYGH